MNKPNVEEQLRALLATSVKGRDAKGKIDLDMGCVVCVFLQAARYHRESVSNAFLVEILRRVNDWRAFLSMINSVFEWDAEGRSLLAFARKTILPLMPEDPRLLEKLVASCGKMLLVKHYSPSIPRLAFNVVFRSGDTTRRFLDRFIHSDANRNPVFLRQFRGFTHVALLLFLEHDVQDPLVVEPIMIYAHNTHDAAAFVAAEAARRRLETI